MVTSDAIKMALIAGKKAQADLADELGVSKQAIGNKVTRGNWTSDDLLKVANLTGGKLLFEYSDGTKIVIGDPGE
jgi:DNA-binding XRE family transcriptional regulator